MNEEVIWFAYDIGMFSWGMAFIQVGPTVQVVFNTAGSAEEIMKKKKKSKNRNTNTNI